MHVKVDGDGEEEGGGEEVIARGQEAS